MIKRNFLTPTERDELLECAKDGLGEHRYGRRANAILLLDKGMPSQKVAEILYIDETTVRNWYKEYSEFGFDALMTFDHGGRHERLNDDQKKSLSAWVTEKLPRTTREVGEWIKQNCGIEYQGRSSLIKLLHRLGFDYKKPKTVSKNLDPQKQKTFIDHYNDLSKHLSEDEVIVFADAVHPAYAVKAVGCWSPKDQKIAVEQTSGRERINFHGAINLETGQTKIIETLTVNAESTINLLAQIEQQYPNKRKIHVILDNARYHHAVMVKQWLALENRRIKLHFIPPYSPHLNPIERLWGVMHKNITHNRTWRNKSEFVNAVSTFLTDKIPNNWKNYCDLISDNFRIINPKVMRIL